MNRREVDLSELGLDEPVDLTKIEQEGNLPIEQELPEEWIRQEQQKEEREKDRGPKNTSRLRPRANQNLILR